MEYTSRPSRAGENSTGCNRSQEHQKSKRRIYAEHHPRPEYPNAPESEQDRRMIERPICEQRTSHRASNVELNGWNKTGHSLWIRFRLLFRFVYRIFLNTHRWEWKTPSGKTVGKLILTEMARASCAWSTCWIEQWKAIRREAFRFSWSRVGD